MEACGLKSKIQNRLMKACNVTPYGGVWIEIPYNEKQS